MSVVDVSAPARIPTQAGPTRSRPAMSSAGNPHRVLLLTALAGFLAFLDVTIVNIAFPQIRLHFAPASLPALSWVLNAYNVLLAALLIPAGRWADAVGRRRILLLGLGVFLAASAVCGLSPDVVVLIGGRSLQALGAALLVPSSVAILLHAAPPEKRATFVGLWAAAGAVAAAVGPPLGGLLIDLGGWRAVFLVNIPLALVVALLAARYLPESRDRAPRARPGITGMLLLAGIFGLLSLGLVQGGEWGWTNVRTLACFVGSADALIAFVALNARSRHPVVDTALFTNRRFSVANAGTLLFSAAFYGLLLNYVLFLTEVWHYSVLKAGVAMAPGALFAAIAAIPAGRIADKVGHRGVAFAGCLVYIAGCLLFADHTSAAPHYLTDWLPFFFLTGAGTGMTLPTLLAAALSPLPTDRFATGSSINTTARQIGGVLGIAVVVAVLSGAGSHDVLARHHRVWLLAAAAGVVVALLTLFLRPEAEPDVTAPDVTDPGRAAVEVRPSNLQRRRRYAWRYYRIAIPSILRRHRPHADTRGRWYSTSFRLSAEQYGGWRDMFDVAGGAQPPLTYHSTSGTLALMRLLGDTGVNFRYLLHLRTESSRDVGADSIEPHREYCFRLRLADVVRLSDRRVGLVVESEVRTRGGSRLQRNVDTFLIRRISPAAMRRLDPSPGGRDLDPELIAGRQPRLVSRPARRRIPVGPTMGRRYGYLSGDLNLVHTTPAAARLFGYEKPFVQGLCTSSFVVSELTAVDDRPLAAWSVTFCRPVHVNQHVELVRTHSAFEMVDAGGKLVAFGIFSRHPAGHPGGDRSDHGLGCGCAGLVRHEPVKV
jgi:EmrB/QacA subfamily drug resistance transporter